MRYWEALTIACLVIIIGGFIIVRGYGTALQDELEPTWKEQLLERAREWNEQKAVNETLLIADRFVCFDDLNDYFKFRLEHDNETDYTVAFPCPELDLKKIPRDESNK